MADRITLCLGFNVAWLVFLFLLAFVFPHAAYFLAAWTVASYCFTAVVLLAKTAIAAVKAVRRLLRRGQ
jgi:multisubunit Na+/H+ antiporter MnhE subunit